MGFRIRLAIQIVVSILAAFALYRWTATAVRDAPPRIPPAEFLAELDRGNVRDIVIDDDWQALSATLSDRGRVRVTLAVDKPLALRWRDRGISVKVERPTVSP